MDASSLGAVDGLIKALERMCTRALKTMSIMMVLEGGSGNEAQANRAWEIHAAAVKSTQHTVETLLQQMFNVALQAQGIPARTRVRFAELCFAELLRDEQVRTMQIANADSLYQQGVITQDQRAQLLGYAKAAEERPIGTTEPTGTIVGGQPDPGSTRVLVNGRQNGQHVEVN